jgi:hypothetical protein
MRLQPELEVPSLYLGNHTDSTGEPLEEDYALVREMWADYRAGLPRPRPVRNLVRRLARR